MLESLQIKAFTRKIGIIHSLKKEKTLQFLAATRREVKQVLFKLRGLPHTSCAAKLQKRAWCGCYFTISNTPSV